MYSKQWLPDDMDGRPNEPMSAPPLSHPISTRKSATSLLRTEIVDVRRLTARRHTAQSGASESTSTQLPKRVNVIRGKRKAWLLSWPLAVCNLAVGPGRSGRCAAEQRSLELEVPVPAESESAESLSLAATYVAVAAAKPTPDMQSMRSFGHHRVLCSQGLG